MPLKWHWRWSSRKTFDEKRVVPVARLVNMIVWGHAVAPLDFPSTNNSTRN